MSGKKGSADTSRGPLFDDTFAPVHEWGAEAARLRIGEQWSYQRIYEHLREYHPDISYRQVYVELNRDRVKAWDKASEQGRQRDRAAYQRKLRRRKAPKCPQCRRKMNSNRVQPGAICRRCRTEQWHGVTVPRMIELWNAGEQVPAIAAELGVGVQSVYATLSLARTQGMTVNYRRPRKVA